MFKKLGCWGQTSLEYVAVIIILIGAFLAMQNYFKRGIQGRMKSSVDSVGEQYDPMKTETDIIQSVTGNVTTTVRVEDGVSGARETTRVDDSIMTEIKSGTTRVDAY